MSLPEVERLRLVWELWDSIMDKSKIPVPKADIEEMGRRLDQYLADGDKGKTWEEVRKSISKK
jgi:putative addiction module component (TIGR02574 family)